MYRPARIDVCRSVIGFTATVTLRDDGLLEDGTEQLYRGFDVEQSGYGGWTHRRAWRNAYRGCGGRLYDVPSDRELAELTGARVPRDPGLRTRS